MGIENEEPKSRKEQYYRKLGNIAGATIPDHPRSRNEEYLAYIIEHGGGGGGGTTNYNALTNKPQINGVTLEGNKTADNLNLVAKEEGKGLSSNDYTTTEKTKLAGLSAVSGTNDGTNWQTITIGDTTKNIPAGGTGGVTSVNGMTGTVVLTAENLSAIPQKITMPTASASLFGHIVQYIGTTITGFTNGYFYKCTSDGAATPTYSWTQVNVQPTSESSNPAIVLLEDETVYLKYPAGDILVDGTEYKCWNKLGQERFTLSNTPATGNKSYLKYVKRLSAEILKENPVEYLGVWAYRRPLDDFVKNGTTFYCWYHYEDDWHVATVGGAWHTFFTTTETPDTTSTRYNYLGNVYDSPHILASPVTGVWAGEYVDHEVQTYYPNAPVTFAEIGGSPSSNENLVAYVESVATIRKTAENTIDAWQLAHSVASDWGIAGLNNQFVTAAKLAVLKTIAEEFEDEEAPNVIVPYTASRVCYVLDIVESTSEIWDTPTHVGWLAKVLDPETNKIATLYTENAGDVVFHISTVEVGKDGVLAQVTEMPDEYETEEGTIVQYVGDTTTTAPIYTNGHIYKLMDDYVWEEIPVQEEHGLQQLTGMPIASAALVGKIVQYVGATDSTYTKGYIYLCRQVTGVAAYEWAQINVQPAGSSGSTVTVSADATNSGNPGRKITVDGTDYNVGGLDYINSYVKLSDGEIYAKDSAGNIVVSGTTYYAYEQEDGDQICFAASYPKTGDAAYNYTVGGITKAGSTDIYLKQETSSLAGFTEWKYNTSSIFTKYALPDTGDKVYNASGQVSSTVASLENATVTLSTKTVSVISPNVITEWANIYGNKPVATDDEVGMVKGHPWYYGYTEQDALEDIYTRFELTLDTTTNQFYSDKPFDLFKANGAGYYPSSAPKYEVVHLSSPDRYVLKYNDSEQTYNVARRSNLDFTDPHYATITDDGEIRIDIDEIFDEIPTATREHKGAIKSSEVQYFAYKSETVGLIGSLIYTTTELLYSEEEGGYYWEDGNLPLYSDVATPYNPTGSPYYRWYPATRAGETLYMLVYDYGSTLNAQRKTNDDKYDVAYVEVDEATAKAKISLDGLKKWLPMATEDKKGVLRLEDKPYWDYHAWYTNAEGVKTETIIRVYTQLDSLASYHEQFSLYETSGQEVPYDSHGGDPWYWKCLKPTGSTRYMLIFMTTAGYVYPTKCVPYPEKGGVYLERYHNSYLNPTGDKEFGNVDVGFGVTDNLPTIPTRGMAKGIPNNIFYNNASAPTADAGMRGFCGYDAQKNEIVRFLTKGEVTSLDSMPIGSITPYAGNTPPQDWLICNGQAISRATYSELFAKIGTTYGSGDGSTTFNVPDLTARTIYGAGTRTITYTDTSGTTKTRTITMGTLGQAVEEELPNIRGSIYVKSSSGSVDEKADGVFVNSKKGTNGVTPNGDNKDALFSFRLSAADGQSTGVDSEGHATLIDRTSTYKDSGNVKTDGLAMNFIIKYTQIVDPATYTLNEIKTAMVDYFYPVGSYYIQADSVDPNTKFTGTTWTEVTTTDNRFPMFSSSQEVGTTLAEQLPNITGGFTSSTNGGLGTLSGGTGAFTTSGSAHTCDKSESTTSRNLTATFNASNSSSVYTDGGVVRPNTVTWKLWVRTA